MNTLPHPDPLLARRGGNWDEHTTSPPPSPGKEREGDKEGWNPFLRWELLGTEDSTETVAIVDIIVIGVGTGVIARYPRVVVVDLLGELLPIYLSGAAADRNRNRVRLFLSILWKYSKEK